jgi:hypothetical protein
VRQLFPSRDLAQSDENNVAVNSEIRITAMVAIEHRSFAFINADWRDEQVVADLDSTGPSSALMAGNCSRFTMWPPLIITVSPFAIDATANKPRPSMGLSRTSLFRCAPGKGGYLTLHASGIEDE